MLTTYHCGTIKKTGEAYQYPEGLLHAYYDVQPNWHSIHIAWPYQYPEGLLPVYYHFKWLIVVSILKSINTPKGYYLFTTKCWPKDAV